MRHLLPRRSFSSLPLHQQNVWDVVIVGGGIVGSTLACLLNSSPSPLRVAVIEPQVPSLLTSPDLRVYTLAPSTISILKRANVWDTIPSELKCPFTAMQVWDTAEISSLLFTASEVGRENMGNVVEHNVLHNALYSEIQKIAKHQNDAENFKVYEERVGGYTAASSTSRFPSITLTSGETLTSRLVVAADGGNSFIRKTAALGTWGREYDQVAVVATVQTETVHSTAWQRFLKTGPVALLPMRDGMTSVVWSCSIEMANSLTSMSDADFVEQLNTVLHLLGDTQAATSCNNTIPIVQDIQSAVSTVLSAAALTAPRMVTPPTVTAAIGSRMSFPLKMQLSNAYCTPGMALVGDAAHTVHPMAGQGLNLGFSDVDALWKEINFAIEHGLDLGSMTVLQRYASHRQKANTSMALTLDGLKHLFSNDAPILPFLRNVGLGTLNGLPIIKVILFKLFLKFENELFFFVEGNHASCYGSLND